MNAQSNTRKVQNALFKRIFRRAGRNNKTKAMKDKVQIKLVQRLAAAKKAANGTALVGDELETSLEKFYKNISTEYPDYAKEPNSPVAVPVPVQQVTTTTTTTTSTTPLTPPSLPDESGNVIVRRTLAQGDCFFSSIYRAALERGLALDLATCLGVRADTEVHFITDVRNQMADYITKYGLLKGKDRYGKNSDTWDFLKELVDTATYKSASGDFPPWFIREFGSTGSRLGTRDEFTKKFAAGIRTMGNWVGELEVNLFRHLLEEKKCPFQVDVTRTMPKTLPKTANGKHIITTYNPQSGHYEYFSFELNNKLAMFPEAYPPAPPRATTTTTTTTTSQAAKKPIKQAVSLLSIRSQQQIAPMTMTPFSTTTTSSGPCTILYDPCTGKVLSPNTLAELEKRVAALKATSTGTVKQLIGGRRVRRKTRRLH